MQVGDMDTWVSECDNLKKRRRRIFLINMRICEETGETERPIF